MLCHITLVLPRRFGVESISCTLLSIHCLVNFEWLFAGLLTNIMLLHYVYAVLASFQWLIATTSHDRNLKIIFFFWLQINCEYSVGTVSPSSRSEMPEHTVNVTVNISPALSLAVLIVQMYVAKWSKQAENFHTYFVSGVDISKNELTAIYVQPSVSSLFRCRFRMLFQQIPLVLHFIAYCL